MFTHFDSSLMPMLIALGVGILSMFSEKAREFAGELSMLFLNKISIYDISALNVLVPYLRKNYHYFQYKPSILRSMTDGNNINTRIETWAGTVYFSRKGIIIINYWGDLIAVKGITDLNEIIAAAHADYNPCQSQGFCVIDVADESGDAKDEDRNKGRKNSYGLTVAEFSSTVVSNDPMHGVFYNDDILDLINQIKHWKDNRQFYVSHGIPWRMGFLTHGPGGTGKSLLAKTVAKVLDYPLYNFHLSGLNESKLRQAWNGVQKPCVINIDDFDAVFNKRVYVGSVGAMDKALTFDTILNMISGVNSADGICLFISTNRPEEIDPALGTLIDFNKPEGIQISTRPGRCDKTVYMGPASLECATKMANFVLSEWPELIEEVLRDYKPVPITQFSNKCTSAAYRRLNEE